MTARRFRGRSATSRDDGQTTLEYFGVLAIVVLVLSLVLATDPGGVVTSGTKTNVQRVLSGTAGERAASDAAAAGDIAGTTGGAGPVGGAGQGPPELVLASASGGGGGSGGTWRRVLRDVCVVLVLVCGNVTDKNPLNDANVPKPPSTQQQENKDKREEETTPRQPAAEPSSGATLTPQPLTTQQPQQAPPIGDEPDEGNGALAWLGDAANAVWTGVVIVVGGILTFLSWFVPRPGMA